MADGFEKINPRDKGRLSASTINQFIESAQSIADIREIFETAETEGLDWGNIHLVKNQSGSAVDIGGVLQVSDILIHPTNDQFGQFYDKPHLTGTTPSVPSGWGKAAIAVEPIPDTDIGRFWIGNIAICKLQVAQDWHIYADVEDNNQTRLLSHPSGSWQILWKEVTAAPGEGWAVVLFTGLTNRILAAKVITSTISPGGSGTVEFQFPKGTDTGEQVTANLDPSATEVNADDIVFVRYDAEDNSWDIIHFPSPTTAGDTVCLVEITDSDGSFTPTDDYELVTRSSTDCVFRGRIIDHSNEDSADLCTRSNVVDGNDVWIKVRRNPWAEDQTQDLIGATYLARKVKDSKDIGGNDFPFYEAVGDDSRVWGLVATGSNWLGTKNAQVWNPGHTIQLTVGGDATIDDPANLWDNVLSGALGHGIKVGDKWHPIAMERRSQRISFTLDTHLSALDTNQNIQGVGTSIGDPPFTGFPGATDVDNPGRLAAPDGTTGIAHWNSVESAYEAVSVDRSSPMVVEIEGTDADGQAIASILSAGTSLAVWDARLVTPNQTSGSLVGGITTVDEPTVWFGFFDHANSSNPHYLQIGAKFLAYDTGMNFTPTGQAQRRLYLARDLREYWDIPVWNNLAETIPAYALMIGEADINLRAGTKIPLVEVSKPNGSTTQDTVVKQILINGPVQIPAGEFGFGADPAVYPVPVDIGTGSAGDIYGPDPAGASWQAEVNETDGTLVRLSSTGAPAGTAYVKKLQREWLAPRSGRTRVTDYQITKNTTANKIDFDGAVSGLSDNEISYSAANDEWTIPADGLYLLEYHVWLAPDQADMTLSGNNLIFVDTSGAELIKTYWAGGSVDATDNGLIASNPTVSTDGSGTKHGHREKHVVSLVARLSKNDTISVQVDTPTTYDVDLLEARAHVAWLSR